MKTNHWSSHFFTIFVQIWSKRSHHRLIVCHIILPATPLSRDDPGVMWLNTGRGQGGVTPQFKGHIDPSRSNKRRIKSLRKEGLRCLQRRAVSVVITELLKYQRRIRTSSRDDHRDNYWWRQGGFALEILVAKLCHFCSSAAICFWVRFLVHSSYYLWQILFSLIIDDHIHAGNVYEIHVEQRFKSEPWYCVFFSCFCEWRHLWRIVSSQTYDFLWHRSQFQ